MFERLTRNADRVRAFAGSEAARLGHDYVGTQHLLLGVMRIDTSVSARALFDRGVNMVLLRECVLKSVETGVDRDYGSRLPPTRQTRKVIENAIQIARAQDHVLVGVEHLLLGLLQASECVAVCLLAQLQVNVDEVRDAIFTRMRQGDFDAGAPLSKAWPFQEMNRLLRKINVANSNDAGALTLRQIQDLIEKMYSAKDRKRGPEGTFLWLMEEVGELATAVREGTREEKEGEYADVLAWLVTLANVEGIDLTHALRKYTEGCPGCGKMVCSCNEKP